MLGEHPSYSGSSFSFVHHRGHVSTAEPPDVEGNINQPLTLENPEHLHVHYCRFPILQVS